MERTLRLSDSPSGHKRKDVRRQYVTTCKVCTWAVFAGDATVWSSTTPIGISHAACVAAQAKDTT